MQDARCFWDGAWREGASETVLADKYSGQPVTRVALPSREQVDEAVRAVAAGQEAVRLTNHERWALLHRASGLLAERRERFVDAIVTDSGFTVADAEREVDRAVETLQLCAEESRRIAGHVVPLEGAAGVQGRFGITVMRPLGVIVAITPFNSPLNTVCHKVGPAIAAGNGIVLKPAPETPLTACLLIELLLDAGVDGRTMALLHGAADQGQWLLEHPVPAFYAFTGSTRVGEHIAATVGLRRRQLELGSLASTIVCADADLDRVAAMCVGAAFRKAGQVCTSVQRLYVEQDAVDEFSAMLRRHLEGKVVGDPRAAGAFVGPLISPAAAERVESWISAAADRGAEVLTGGTRTDSVISPTILSGVAEDMQVMCQEVFGPVVSLRPFTSVDDAIAEANRTPYGLAAGIFTSNLDVAMRAAQDLRVGTVNINDTSSARVDLMPFGGVKASGTGMEGPKYAIREMSEETLVTFARSRP